MFKRVLQSLTRSFSSSAPPPQAVARRVSEGSVLEKLARARPSSGPVSARISAEELCEIHPSMSKSDILARLKLLHRRYNRGASSLDARLRSEAERMLDAIVEVREKHLGGI